MFTICIAFRHLNPLLYRWPTVPPPQQLQAIFSFHSSIDLFVGLMLLRLYFMDMHELRFKLHAVSQAVPQH